MKSLIKMRSFAIYILLVTVLVSCNHEPIREKAIEPYKVELSLKNDTIKSLTNKVAKMQSEIAGLKNDIEIKNKRLEMKEKIIAGLDKYNLLHYETYGY